jgi:hypothetical protein
MKTSRRYPYCLKIFFVTTFWLEISWRLSPQNKKILLLGCSYEIWLPKLYCLEKVLMRIIWGVVLKGRHLQMLFLGHNVNACECTTFHLPVSHTCIDATREAHTPGETDYLIETVSLTIAHIFFPIKRLALFVLA